MKTLVVVGQGYVGLPMALRAAEVGFKVYGLDTNHSTVDALNQGRSHIDDVSDEDLKTSLAAGYQATVDPASIASANVGLVCVPTPRSADRRPDLKGVGFASEAISAHFTPDSLAEEAKACTTERKDYVASIEASSVRV